MFFDLLFFWLLILGGHENELALQEQYENLVQLHDALPEDDASQMMHSIMEQVSAAKKSGEYDPNTHPPYVFKNPEPFDFSEFLPSEPELPENIARHATFQNGQYVLYGAAQIIADCESGDRLPNGNAAPHTYNWTNLNGQGSTAAGAFQFLNSTWRWVAHEQLGYTQYPTALDAPPDVQIVAFDWLWDNGNGRSHWAPSQSCWGHTSQTES